MVCCSVINCKNRSVKDGQIRFFSFPKEEALANAWLMYCRPKTNKRNGRVCSDHFITTDYHKPLRHILMNTSPIKFRCLKPDAIPSLHIDGIPQPVKDERLDTAIVTELYCEPDLPLTEHKELTN